MIELDTQGLEVRQALQALPPADAAQMVLDFVAGGSATQKTQVRTTIGAASDADAVSEAKLATLGGVIRTAIEALAGADRAALLLALTQGASTAQKQAIRDALGAPSAADTVTSPDVDVIRVMTQAEYDALTTKDPRTRYEIEG